MACLSMVMLTVTLVSPSSGGKYLDVSDRNQEISWDSRCQEIRWVLSGQDLTDAVWLATDGGATAFAWRPGPFGKPYICKDQPAPVPPQLCVEDFHTSVKSRGTWPYELAVRLKSGEVIRTWSPPASAGHPTGPPVSNPTIKNK
jgi:hypothetical protein